VKLEYLLIIYIIGLNRIVQYPVWTVGSSWVLQAKVTYTQELTEI